MRPAAELRAIGATHSAPVAPCKLLTDGGQAGVANNAPADPTPLADGDYQTTDDHANRDRPVCVVSAPFHEANNA